MKCGRGTATTIGIVATDAVRSKAQAKRLALMAHHGLTRAVLPAHAPLDGDTIFVAATGTRARGHSAPTPPPMSPLSATPLPLVVARAVAVGVYEATALPIPGASRLARPVQNVK